MHDIFMEEAQDFPIWLSPLKSKSNNSPFDVGVTHSVEHWRSLAGSPFDSSDSDSSSECDDDTMSLDSSDLTMREAPFSGDVSLISEGIGTLSITASNVLGLIFMSNEEPLATEAVATFAQQAEGLQAPQYHQDDRSCGRPNQECHAQFPQDFGLRADVGDDTGPKAFQGLGGSPVESFGDGCDWPDTYDHDLRAPRMKSISLPEEQEYDEGFLYSGPALGGWLTGTLDGVPKTMPGLSGLDFDLPMPFAVEV